MPSVKIELSAASVKMYIDLHIQLKIPFEVTLTNYTTRIKSDLYDLSFMRGAQSDRVFITYAMVKKDVIKKPLPDINISKMKYFQAALKQNEIYADKIYNVDIKSAYASILLSDGFISPDTFGYIKRLSKIERLAAVGMLAGRKNIFSFNDEGKVQSRLEIISPTANYFFYAVDRVYEIIDRCKMEIGNDFLFSWVDGIYFVNESNGPILQDLLLSEFKLNSSFDELAEFEVKLKGDYHLLSYLKDGERKVFSIPTQDTTQKQDIYNYLLTKKQ